MRSFAKTPTLEEFTDTLQADIDRQHRNVQQIDNLNAYFDLARGRPLPAANEARQHAHTAFQELVNASRDPRHFASGNIQMISANLAAPAEKFVNACATYCLISLKANQESHRLGTRTDVGVCVQITWYTHQHEQLDTSVAPRLMQFAAERLPPAEGGEVPLREHTIAYIRKAAGTPPQFGLAAPYRREINRCIERYPAFLKPLFRLEHGHKIEGQGDSLSVLLLGNVVVGIFPPVEHAPPVMPSQRRRDSSMKAKPTQRRTVWSTKLMVAFLTAVLVNSVALLFFYSHDRSLAARLQLVEQLAPAIEILNTRIAGTPTDTTIRNIAREELRGLTTRIAAHDETLHVLEREQATFQSQWDADSVEVKDYDKTLSQFHTQFTELQREQQRLSSELLSIATEQASAQKSLSDLGTRVTTVEYSPDTGTAVDSAAIERRVTYAEQSIASLRSAILTMQSVMVAGNNQSPRHRHWSNTTLPSSYSNYSLWEDDTTSR